MNLLATAGGQLKDIRGGLITVGWPAIPALATVLAQIAYPLAPGRTRGPLTVSTVVLFATASIGHAWLVRGPRFAVQFAGITAGIGLAVEALGVHTGVPFGSYSYTSHLGWRFLGVPIVIPLAWSMMAYPAWLVGRAISTRPRVSVLAGGIALASWDVFLDPQMVAAGNWHWARSQPGLFGIPLSNYVGWLVTAIVMMAVLTLVTGRQAGRPYPDRLPIALYLWTYASSILANAVFFDRPEVAAVGAAAMGIPVGMLLHALRHR